MYGHSAIITSAFYNYLLLKFYFFVETLFIFLLNILKELISTRIRGLDILVGSFFFKHHFCLNVVIFIFTWMCLYGSKVDKCVYMFASSTVEG